MYYFSLFDDQDTSLLQEVTNIYYRGLDRSPELLTLTQATLTFPLLFVGILYLPTVLYLIITIAANSSKKMKILDYALLFVIPLFTNLYFSTEDKPNICNKSTNLAKKKQDSALKKSESMPALERDYIRTRQRSTLRIRSQSVPNIDLVSNRSTFEQPEFSQFHSNVLYLIFCVGFTFLMSLDLGMQYRRNGHSYKSPVFLFFTVTFKFLVVFVINLVLWVDLNLNLVATQDGAGQQNQR